MCIHGGFPIWPRLRVSDSPLLGINNDNSPKIMKILDLCSGTRKESGKTWQTASRAIPDCLFDFKSPVYLLPSASPKPENSRPRIIKFRQDKLEREGPRIPCVRRLCAEVVVVNTVWVRRVMTGLWSRGFSPDHARPAPDTSPLHVFMTRRVAGHLANP